MQIEKLTPMMQQYMETKNEYKDCLLFYRLGDFYEMFFDDALTCSRELEITLTGKNCGLEERAPMCGIPFHAVEGYLSKLISKGYKVAICEQVEDPKQSKGLVKREVTRIVTPGTNLNTQTLDETKNNYLMCIIYTPNAYGISIIDVTTGDFYVTEVENSRKLLDEINKFTPSEIICNESFYVSNVDMDDLRERLHISISSLETTLTAAGVSKSLVSILCAVTTIGSKTNSPTFSSANADVPPQITDPVIRAVINKLLVTFTSIQVTPLKDKKL